MKNTFAVGAVAGITSLVIAVPLLAQVTGAQTSSSSATSAPVTQTETDTQIDPTKAAHVGANGQHEELLTGDNAAKATAAALAAVPGGTIDRVETDTEGDVYEAHMTKSDGSRVTVKFDAGFNVTNIEEGRGMKR